MNPPVLDSLIRASEQGLVAFGLVLIVTLILHRLSTDLKCWLWRLVALKFLLSLAVAIPVTAPMGADAIPLNDIASPRAKSLTRPEPAGAPPSPAPMEAKPSAAEPAGFQVPWVGIWACGVLLFGLRSGSGYVRLCRIIRAAKPIDVGPVSFPTLVSPDVQFPAVAGIIRPTVLLPAVSSSLPPILVDVALAHEAAHVQRRDPLWQMVVEFTKTIFWFHPAAWLIPTLHRRELETATDELALRQLATSPKEYGEAILTWVARTRSENATQLLNSVSLSANSDLTYRIQRLKTKAYPMSTQRLILATLAIPLAIGFLPLALASASVQRHSNDTRQFDAIVVIPKSNRSADLLIPSSNRASSDRALSSADAERSWRNFSQERLGETYTAKVGDETVTLLAISSLDPKNPVSWSPDGKRLRKLPPFLATTGVPGLNQYMEYSRDGKEHQVTTKNRFVRQFLFAISKGATSFKASINTKAPYTDSNTMAVPGHFQGMELIAVDQEFPDINSIQNLDALYCLKPTKLAEMHLAPGQSKVSEKGFEATLSAATNAMSHGTAKLPPKFRDAFVPKLGDMLLTIKLPGELGESFRVKAFDRSGLQLPLSSVASELRPRTGTDPVYMSHGHHVDEVARVEIYRTRMVNIRFQGVHIQPVK